MATPFARTERPGSPRATLLSGGRRSDRSPSGVAGDCAHRTVGASLQSCWSRLRGVQTGDGRPPAAVDRRKRHASGLTGDKSSGQPGRTGQLLTAGVENSTERLYCLDPPSREVSRVLTPTRHGTGTSVLARARRCYDDCRGGAVSVTSLFSSASPRPSKRSILSSEKTTTPSSPARILASALTVSSGCHRVINPDGHGPVTGILNPGLSLPAYDGR